MKGKRKGQKSVGFITEPNVYKIRASKARGGVGLISNRFRKRRETSPPRFVVSPINESALLEALPLTWKSCSRDYRLSPRQFAALFGSDKVIPHSDFSELVNFDPSDHDFA
jgi:hypothetical protein